MCNMRGVNDGHAVDASVCCFPFVLAAWPFYMIDGCLTGNRVRGVTCSVLHEYMCHCLYNESTENRLLPPNKWTTQHDSKVGFTPGKYEGKFRYSFVESKNSGNKFMTHGDVDLERRVPLGS